jgi:hypothetical protein
MYRFFKSYFKSLQQLNTAKKYAVAGVFLLLVLLSASLLTAQLFTVRQLVRVSGTIVKTDEELTSYKGGRRGGGNYSLILTLDNQKNYNVELDDSNWGIQNTDYKGQKAIIYTPTTAYNILSLDFIDFGTRVSQCEVNGQVLYSFDHHQRGNQPIILLILFALTVYCYQLYRWHSYQDMTE